MRTPKNILTPLDHDGLPHVFEIPTPVTKGGRMTTAVKAKGLYPALLAFQQEAPALQKTAINPHFNSKFVSLDVLTEAVTPILNKHGLVWTALPGHTENGSPTLNYALIHADTGEKLTGAMALLPQKTDPQGQGSAITYARRYALMAVLGLVADEDDDGNKASEKPVKAVADQIADLPGTVELVSEPLKKELRKAYADANISQASFESKVRSMGKDSVDDLSVEEGAALLKWLTGQSKRKAA